MLSKIWTEILVWLAIGTGITWLCPWLHGAISSISNGSVTVDYTFTGDALDAGYALAVQGGLAFFREVFRHGYLRSCIVAVPNRCGNISQGLEYSYDALQCPISPNEDTFGYNVRGRWFRL